MTEAQKPKAYSYLRFSTPEQAQGDSQRRQLDKAKEYAGLHGLELDEELTFEDKGLSGFKGLNAKRGALKKFLDAIEMEIVAPGSFLLVENLDRMSRQDPWDALPVFQSIINAGVTIVTVQDGRVWSREELKANPIRIMESLFVMMRANEESATKSRRLKAVYGNKRKQARDGNHEKPFTRRLPAWVVWNEETKRLELIEERAKVVRDIFDMAEAGFGKDAIARTLNDRGVPTFGKAEYWRRSYVEKILTNPACVGTFVPRLKEFEDGKPVRKAEEPIQGYFPAVVSEEVFSRQSLRPKAARGRHSGGVVSSIFQGLGTCARCGSSFVRVSKGKYTYLVCSKAHAKGGCEYRSVPYSEAEEVIRENIVTIADQVPRGENTTELEREIEGVDRAVFDEGFELRVLIDRYAQRPSDAIEQAINDREKKLSEMTERLRNLRKRREELASGLISKRVEWLKEAFAAKPFDRGAANKALGEVVKQFRFDAELGQIDIEWRTGGWEVQTIAIPATKFAKAMFGGKQ
jgi:DNA invertase Pin-like site-specific DNA recombinase